ncbi:hypothetical protein GUJ93_ZPchr0007g5261 [Zizania palustris]|uniref:Uncharacterized protein n=1 Tax=Zizania palustris TaxID=103762 RepID=A0A8J5SLM3_ZIZPA|nr:hypothetical protein GUJ93_ZPchr0007g5261 [Zizania palustris]
MASAVSASSPTPVRSTPATLSETIVSSVPPAAAASTTQPSRWRSRQSVSTARRRRGGGRPCRAPSETAAHEGSGSTPPAKQRYPSKPHVSLAISTSTSRAGDSCGVGRTAGVTGHGVLGAVWNKGQKAGRRDVGW